MFSILLKKELKAIISSPKFTVIFAICAVLMLLSVFIGVNEYNQSVKQYRTAQELSEQRMAEITAWPNLVNKAQREPNPLQIFSGGLNYDIGRWSLINRDGGIKLEHTHYSDNPIYAVFRIMDFSFIVQFILTLFAILFTFDAINGERERGTLQLVFSNPVSRSGYLLAKCLGSWLGLVIPISIPVLLSLLLVVIFRVPLQGEDWAKIISFLGLSLLLFSFFIVLGVLISTFIRRSSISFLTSLIIWVILVLIIPRAGVLAAGQMVYVPRVAEIEGQRDTFAKDKWAKFQAQMEDTWIERNTGPDGGCATDDDEELWKWMKEDDAARKKVEIEIEDYYNKLKDDYRKRKAVRERLAATISRISPASAYQLAAMSLTDTDVALKTRYEDSMNSYRTTFNDYVDKRTEEAGPAGHVVVKVSSEDGFDLSSFDSDHSLDLSGLPRYHHSRRDFKDSFSPAIIDFGMLGIYTLLAFAGAFLRFLKYDIK